MQRVDKACADFYEVASEVINTDDDLFKMRNWIKEVKNEFTSKEASPGIVEDGLVQNQVIKILDPIPTRSKGRPPSKRKSSKVDQTVKKISKKKTQKRSQQSENQQEVILWFVYI